MKSPYLTPVDKYQAHILFTPTPKGIFMSCHQRQITEVIISYLKTGPRKGDLNPFATIHESVSRNLNSTSQQCDLHTQTYSDHRQYKKKDKEKDERKRNYFGNVNMDGSVEA